jgi:hypothetical protein
MKNERASRASEAYAVLDRFSAVSVNYCRVSVITHATSIVSQAHLVATCFNRHRLAELGETYECLIDTSSRLGRQ